MPPGTNSLTSLLRHEIAATGPVSFARFMELALYHPVHGFYCQSLKQIGCQGDFYTSVSVGSLFGELLALQFSHWCDQWLRSPRSPASSRPPPGADGPFQLVEAGAHDGRLAADILTWFTEHRRELLPRLEYWILEPGATARQTQQHRLAPFHPRVHWCAGWPEFPRPGVQGVIFSNELLDALPVQRLGWDAARQAWFEWRVTWADKQFAWQRAEISPRDAEEELALFGTVPRAVQTMLPDGFTVEVCPAAAAWWSEAAARLDHGCLLTLDYGLEDHEFFSPQRDQGTLRSYRSHRLTPDALACPGEQDLTAHVNFSALRRAGERHGLETRFLLPQSQFLTRIAAPVLAGPSAFSWTPERTRQFQTLVHPDHLGHAFSVLLQTRWSGLQS